MLLIIEQVTQEAHEIKEEIQKQEEMMKQKLGDAFAKVEQVVMETTQRYKEYLQATKIKKYKRDTEDYQRNEVYKWENRRHSQQRDDARPRTRAPNYTSETGNTRNTWGRTTRMESNESTLESDSSTYSSRSSPPSSFLTNRTQKKTRKKDADGENAQQRQRPRPWTRSYKQTR